MPTFYLYIYRDPRSQVPFYVGKGKDKRAWSHLVRTDRSQMTNKITQLQRLGITPDIQLFQGLDEELALLAEVEAIDKFGRRDLGTGTLLNLTAGGEGVSGFKPSTETISQRVQSNKAVIERKREAELQKPLPFRDPDNRIQFLKVGDTLPEGYQHTGKSNSLAFIDKARVITKRAGYTTEEIKQLRYARLQTKMSARSSSKKPMKARPVTCIHVSRPSDELKLFLGATCPVDYKIKCRGKFTLDKDTRVLTRRA